MIRFQCKAWTCKKLMITSMFGSVLEIVISKSFSEFNGYRYFVLIATNFENSVSQTYRLMQTESKY